MIRALLAAAVRRLTYPDRDGYPVRRDPTYGRIDRDIQWKVQRWNPGIRLGARVALENTLQAQRDRKRA